MAELDPGQSMKLSISIVVLACVALAVAGCGGCDHAIPIPEVDSDYDPLFYASGGPTRSVRLEDGTILKGVVSAVDGCAVTLSRTQGRDVVIDWHRVVAFQ